MSDLVERLDPKKWWTIDPETRQLMLNARAEIERLQAELDKERDAHAATKAKSREAYDAYLRGSVQ